MNSRKSVVWVSLVVLALAGTGLGSPGGLVAYYPFNGNANDASGTGNNGSPVGGVTWTTGVMGGGIHLDGTGYINVPDSPSLDLPGGSGTISAFIRVDPSSGEFGIVAKESSSSFPSTIAYEYPVRYGGTLEWLYVSNGSTGDSVTNIGGQSLKDSSWHHLAATWSGPGGQLVLYRDGVQVAQGNQTISTINNTSDPVLIGAFRWNVGGEYMCMTGDMDEVRIYNRALSEGEIGALAAIPAPGAVVLAGLGVSVVGWLRRRRYV